MAQRQAKKHKTDAAEKDRLVVQDSLEEKLQSASFGLGQVNDRLSQLDSLAPLGNAGLQGAQRSQYVVSLQRRRGNRYVQRAIEGRASGPAGKQVVHVAPRPETSGTIARDLSPEVRTRLLRQFYIALDRVEADIIQANELLGEDRPPYDVVRGIFDSARRSVVEFIVQYDQWDEVARQAYSLRSLLNQVSLAIGARTAPNVANVPRLLSVARQSAEGFSSSLPTRQQRSWDRNVVQRLAAAEEAITGERPNYARAIELCRAVADYVRDQRQRTTDPALQRRYYDVGHRIADAGMYMSALSAPPGSAGVRDLLDAASEEVASVQQMLEEAGARPPVVFTREGSRYATEEEITEAEAETPGEWVPVGTSERTPPPEEEAEMPEESGPVLFRPGGNIPITPEEIEERGL